MADGEERSLREVDPRSATASAGLLPLHTLASKIGSIEESQEVSRQWAQKFLFFLILGCLGFLALFDSALLLPSVHLETKVILAVNTAFAGGSGVLGVCASYILAPYRASRSRSNSRKPKPEKQSPPP